MFEEDIPLSLRMKLGMSKGERINSMVLNVIENSRTGDKILMSDEYYQYFLELHEFMFTAVYRNPVCKSEEVKAIDMIKKLYNYYNENTDKLPADYIRIAERDGYERAVCDYIAGMSDNYSVKVFNQLFVPKFWVE